MVRDGRRLPFSPKSGPLRATPGNRSQARRDKRQGRAVPRPAELFDYTLPPHLVAQSPAAHRDRSRLLVVDRAKKTLAHRHFADLPEFLRAGDILFRNNAAVLPARLHARKPSGTAIECFLLRPT